MNFDVQLLWKLKNHLVPFSIFIVTRNGKASSRFLWIWFLVLCLNFSLETKIKTLFLISYFNLSKKQNGTLGTWIYFTTRYLKINLKYNFYHTNFKSKSQYYKETAQFSIHTTSCEFFFSKETLRNHAKLDKIGKLWCLLLLISWG